MMIDSDIADMRNVTNSRDAQLDHGGRSFLQRFVQEGRSPGPISTIAGDGLVEQGRQARRRRAATAYGRAPCLELVDRRKITSR